MKIVIGINTLTDVNAGIYRNHLKLFYNIGKWAERNGHDVILIAPHRYGIDNMRNTCAKIALEQDAQYILFVDDDCALLPNTLELLIEDIEVYSADIVAGLTFIRSFPFLPMIYEAINRKGKDIGLRNMINYKDKKNDDGVVFVAAVGFSCALLRVSTLKKIDSPYFVTGPFNTEDIYYCCKLIQELPKEPIILCDTLIEVKHLLEPETVSEVNVEELYKRYAEFSKVDIGVNSNSPDRGTKYHEEIMKHAT